MTTAGERAVIEEEEFRYPTELNFFKEYSYFPFLDLIYLY
jgi:hypothetical protein